MEYEPQAPKTTGSPSSIYEQLFIIMLTFVLLRDSSDLHIYKELYGENNDYFCNLWKCSDLNKNRLTSLYVFPSCVVFETIYGHSVSFSGTGLSYSFLIFSIQILINMQIARVA